MSTESPDDDFVNMMNELVLRKRPNIPLLERVKYNKAIVSFIDILGFSDAVRRYSAKEVAKILSVFYRSGKRQLSEKIKVYIFSDSIVRVAPTSLKMQVGPIDQGPLSVELDNLAWIQFELACWYGIFIRGGVTIGDVCARNGMIFGPGLIEAYKLESTYSIYPRLAIHPKIIKSLKTSNVLWQKADDEIRNRFLNPPLPNMPHGRYNLDYQITSSMISKYIVRDGDILFIDYLNGTNFGYNAESMLIHKNSIELGYRRSQNDRVRDKYAWLAEYHNFALSRSPSSSDFSQAECAQYKIDNFELTPKKKNEFEVVDWFVDLDEQSIRPKI